MHWEGSLKMRSMLFALVAIHPWTSALACKPDTQVIEDAVKRINLLVSPCATEFCRSYLHIPATVTSFETVTPTTTLTLTSTTTTSDPECPITATPDNPEKRGIDGLEEQGALRLPPGLLNFEPCVISKACSRLSLAPTATITITDTASAATTQTVTIIATSTVCSGCIPDNSPCNIQLPGECCGQACFCGDSLTTCHCIGAEWS